MNMPKTLYFKASVESTRAGSITISDFEAAPDAVEIVRCEDCVHWYKSKGNDGCLGSCEMDALIRHCKFFCASGAKREIFE